MPFFSKKHIFGSSFALAFSFFSITMAVNSQDLPTALSLLKAKLLSLAGQLNTETLTNDPFYNPPQFNVLEELKKNLRIWQDEGNELTKKWPQSIEGKNLKIVLSALLEKNLNDRIPKSLFGMKTNIDGIINLLNEKLNVNINYSKNITIEHIKQLKNAYKKNNLIKLFLEKIFKPIFEEKLATKKIQSNQNPNPLVIKYIGKIFEQVTIYDIDPFVYHSPSKQKYEEFKPTIFTSKQEIGCGFHTMKNLIFMTKILTEKEKNQREAALNNMNSYQVFLHYGEGGIMQDSANNHDDWRKTWEDDEQGENNWVSIWKTKPSSPENPIPETFLEDILEFRRIVEKEKIQKNKVFLPAGSKKILENAIVIGDITWAKELCIKDKILIKYLNDNDNKELIRKFQT